MCVCVNGWEGEEMQIIAIRTLLTCRLLMITEVSGEISCSDITDIWELFFDDFCGDSEVG